MKLFYAMGGGWGHLQRVRTFINQFQFSEFRIVSNNPQASRLFERNKLIIPEGDTPDALSQSIQKIFGSHDAEEVYVDTFPNGLFGELNDIRAKKIYYLARRLKWDVYTPLLSDAIFFDKTFCLEELEPDHQRYVDQHSRHVEALELNYPSGDMHRIPKAMIPRQRPIWLIVHAFVQEEVDALVAYARDVALIENQTPAFVVITDQPSASENSLAYFPAVDWFPLADRIFTGGGFNVMQEAKRFPKKIHAIPFPRKYDDQYWRVGMKTCNLKTCKL